MIPLNNFLLSKLLSKHIIAFFRSESDIIRKVKSVGRIKIWGMIHLKLNLNKWTKKLDRIWY